MFVSGLTAIAGPLQWLAAICGWVGIVYVMFGGARRLGCALADAHSPFTRARGGYFSWICLPVRCSISIS